MLRINFRKDVYELLVKSIENDTNTFTDDGEKNMVLSIINHFFDVNGWDNFGEFEITLDDFNKYYKDSFTKYKTELVTQIVIDRFMEEEDESK